MPTGSVGAAGSPTASGDESPDIIDDDVGSAEGFDFEEDELEGLEEVGEFFSEARLQELAGSDDVESVTFLEVRINSEEIVMRDLGVRLPGLSELKLNNSNIPSFRDLGTSFKNVKVLWLARSNVQELDGMSGLDSIRELYLGFNEIKDLSAVMGCGTLEVLDLEGNCIEDLGEVQFLASCERLSVVTLEGNPIANADKYRADVLEALPQVDVLDDVERGDTVCLGGSDDESMGMPGGRSFALNVSAGLDQELDEVCRCRCQCRCRCRCRCRCLCVVVVPESFSRSTSRSRWRPSRRASPRARARRRNCRRQRRMRKRWRS